MAAVADLNGDGIPDIVTANGYADNGGKGISLLLGKGDGTFQAARSILTTGNPGFLAVGDFNNDGKLDLAVASGTAPGGTVSILFGNGDGTFQPAIDTFTVGATSLVAADFNGDGKLDLAVTGTSGGATGMVLLGKGDGTFTTSYTTLINSTKVLAADVNGDGKPDLVFFGTIGAVKLGNGDGTFRDGQANLQGFSNIFAAVGDFNGDGRLDLAIRYSFAGRGTNPPVGVILLGLSDGSFGQQFFTNFSGGPSNMVTADFNGDGILDTGGAGGPSADPSEGVTFGNGDGQFSFGAFGFGVNRNLVPGAFPFPSFAAVGDFDRNGAPDLMVADGNAVEVALNTGGHPPLLATLRLSAPSVFGAGSTVPSAIATAVVGGATPLNGFVYLGGPAPAGGVVVTISSSDPAAFLAGGNTVTIPAGGQGAGFAINTAAVAAPAPVTFSASSGVVAVNSTLTLIPAFTLSSVSISPASIFGLYGGNHAVGTVTLSAPAADGVAIGLTNSNPAAIGIPASVAVPRGATTATFDVAAFPVQADTPVVVSGSLQGNTFGATVTVKKNTPTVVVTKAQYIAVKLELDVEATSTDGGNLEVVNANTHVLIGFLNFAGGGKSIGRFSVPGGITSIIVQSLGGGMATGPVAQK